MDFGKEQTVLESVLVTSLSTLKDKYAYDQNIASTLDYIIKRTMKKVNNTCPACNKGNLICDLCDYESETKPVPQTLSNSDAHAACACPACDGGTMACDECDYTYDSIKGFNNYVF